MLPLVPSDGQKSFHSMINEITGNPSIKIEERSIKNVELFFDTSLKNGFVKYLCCFFD
jgi:site-specific DNA recombinase